MTTCPDENTLGALLAGLPLAIEERDGLTEHLALCSACAALVPTLLPQGPGLTPPPLGPGDRVDRYVIIQKIGEGAMGVVYEAYDQALQRKVALKLLRAPLLHSGEAALRLLREAQAMARLRHPHIVSVHDVGMCQDPGAGEGRLYLVMDLLSDGTLRTELPSGEGEIVDALLPIGEALAHVHRAGLLHRDVKPDNILRQGTRLVLSDFGLSHLQQELCPNDEGKVQDLEQSNQELTAEGRVLGTPVYMAPEQLRGAPATPLSDQFSFCVTLYEAIQGERPFSGATWKDLHQAILRQQIRPLPEAIPKAISAAIFRGLLPEPGARHQNMDSLCMVLKEARHPQWNRRSWQMLVGIVLLLGLVVGVLGLWHRSYSTMPRACGPLSPPLVPATRDTQAAKSPWVFHFIEEWKHMAEASCRATYQQKVQSSEVFVARQKCLLRSASALEALLLANPSEGEATSARRLLPSPSHCGVSEALSTPPIPASLEAGRDRVAILWIRAALGYSVAEETSALIAQARQEPGGGDTLLREALLLLGATDLFRDAGRAQAELREALALAIAADAQGEVVKGYAYLAHAVSVKESPVEAQGLWALAQAAAERAALPFPPALLSLPLRFVPKTPGQSATPEHPVLR